MTTLDQAIGGAVRHARDAAIRNRGITSCPYPADGTNIQKACRRRWISEYNRRRPDVGKVDFREDVEILAAGDDSDQADTVEADGETDGEADTVEAGELQVPNVLFTLEEAMGPDGARLKRYWTKGEGAAEIGWGTHGDFKRCVAALSRHVADPEGLCNVYHQAAVGAPPGKGHP